MKKLFTLLIGILLLVGCTAKPQVENKEIVVGASPAPHAQILAEAASEVEALGYTLKIVEFTDYVLPNTYLDAGDLDANFFQHLPYLLDFNEKEGTKLASVQQIHFEPLGLYGGKSDSVEALKTDGAVIGIPNDASNESRALRLLEDNGLIKLEANLADVTPLNIVENPYNYEFIEMEAALLPDNLVDFNFAIINGNYAITAKITDKVLLTEDSQSDAAQTYANIIAVQEGKEDSEKTKVLVQALTSAKIKKFIEDTYYPTVITMFE